MVRDSRPVLAEGEGPARLPACAGPFSRRQFLQAGVAGAASALLPLRLRAARKAPNILLIMADDLGTECLGAYGGTSYPTPYLDALSQQGLRFDNCYTTPLCTPSRVMAMTGLYPFRTGHKTVIQSNHTTFLSPSIKNFAHVLRDSGYATAVSGKWQLGRFDLYPDHPRECGFDEYCLWLWSDRGRHVPRYWDPVVYSNGRILDVPSDRYGPDVFCDYLADFMGQNHDGPFFAYYPMTLVHRPFRPTSDQWRFLDVLPARFQGVWFPGLVSYMDKLVGRLVGRLGELGLLEDTLIVFTSDNGTDPLVTSVANGRKIQGGKDQMTEAGTRVPLIMRWPGTIPGGSISDELADLSDLLPTFSELAGSPLPRDARVDGLSLAPLLWGTERDRPRDHVFIQRGEEWYVRNRRWRLHDDGRLFDLTDRYAEARAGPSREAEAARIELSRALPDGFDTRHVKRD